MNNSHKNETISLNGYHCIDNVIDQHGVLELPVFGGKKQKALSQQRKKKVLKPIRQPDTSAARQQQPGLPKNNIDTNKKTGASSNTYNMLLNDHVMRIKNLENKLSEASAKNHELTAENSLLKIREKRYEHALSVHDGKQAKLPQTIKSYEEDIRTLKYRLCQMKTSFTEMESRYKSQTNELLVLQNQRTRNLSLPKKEEHSKINKLNDRLAEAYNTIEQQQNEILNFKQKIEFQNKTHRHDLDSESRRFSDKTENLEMETKHLNARRDFAKGSTETPKNITRRVAKPTICGQVGVIGKSLNQTDGSVPVKPKLPCKKHEDKNKPFRNREKWNKY